MIENTQRTKNEESRGQGRHPDLECPVPHKGVDIGGDPDKVIEEVPVDPPPGGGSSGT